MDDQTKISPILFNKLAKGFGSALLESALDDKNKKAENLATILGVALFTLITGVILLSGTEASSLLLRKNFGRKGIYWLRLVLSIICFIVIGGISYYMYLDFKEKPIVAFSAESFFYGAIFNWFLAVVLILKAVYERNKKEDKTYHISYRGDSYLLAFLMKSSWKQSTVQNFAEPFLLISLGVFLSSYNPLMGLPLLFCGFSSWIHLAWERIKGLLPLRNLLSNKGYVHSQEQTFANVVN